MRVARVLSGEQISHSRDPERRRVRRHVPAVGQQRHRTGQPARHDLAHHHCGCQRHHEPGAAFVVRVLRTKEHVVVGPLVN
jgi:hypothetical protein